MLCDDGKVKILDFGLCALIQDATVGTVLTRTNDLIGSPRYMAPECFKQATRTAQVDIYSAGCILYESLTGSPLTPAESAVAIALQHAQQDIPLLPESLCSITVMERQYLWAIISKACAKSPRDRFADCGVMAQCLQAVLENRTEECPLHKEFVAFRKTEASRKTETKVVLLGCVLVALGLTCMASLV